MYRVTSRVERYIYYIEWKRCLPLFCCVPGVWGVWGLDDVGVTGFLGVNGLAAGFKVNFFGAFCCFSKEVSFEFTGVCCKNYFRWLKKSHKLKRKYLLNLLMLAVCCLVYYCYCSMFEIAKTVLLWIDNPVVSPQYLALSVHFHLFKLKNQNWYYFLVSLCFTSKLKYYNRYNKCL